MAKGYGGRGGDSTARKDAGQAPSVLGWSWRCSGPDLDSGEAPRKKEAPPWYSQYQGGKQNRLQPHNLSLSLL